MKFVEHNQSFDIVFSKYDTSRPFGQHSHLKLERNEQGDLSGLGKVYNQIMPEGINILVRRFTNSHCIKGEKM